MSYLEIYNLLGGIVSLQMDHPIQGRVTGRSWVADLHQDPTSKVEKDYTKVHFVGKCKILISIGNVAVAVLR